MKGKKSSISPDKNQNRSKSSGRRRDDKTTFLFLGNKVMDELRVLARLASPGKNRHSES